MPVRLERNKREAISTLRNDIDECRIIRSAITQPAS